MVSWRSHSQAQTWPPLPSVARALSASFHCQAGWLSGSWSDLALACLIHVGMKRLMPNEDSGLGIGPEYEEAVRLHRGGETVAAHQEGRQISGC
jgi:hypothetical protein